MTRMAVVVVNFNTRELLRSCLASVLLEEPAEVVVVDNGSADDSRALVRNGFPGVLLISEPHNPGFGAAANRGIAACGAPYILLLNADTRLEPGTLRALTAELDRHPKAAVVGPRLLETDGRPQSSWFPEPTPFNLLALNTFLNRLVRVTPGLARRFRPVWGRDVPAGTVPWLKGAALALRREAFQAIGGFDESFFLYAEDVDLCFRFRNAGWEVRFTPAARVIHVEGASTRQVRAESMLRFFDSLARLYRRYYPPSWRARLRRVVALILLERLVRDILKQAFTRDATRRRALAADARLWHGLLTGRRSLGGADPD